MKALDISWNLIVFRFLEDARNNNIVSKIGSRLRTEKDLNYYPWIPAYAEDMVAVIEHVLITVKDLKNKSFLDIGCGVPVMPDLMRLIVNRAYGLDYNEVYCQLNGLIHADLLTFDKYNEYDILYSYNPIIDKELMLKGLKHIMSSMRKNSVFYFIPAHFSGNELKELGFEKVANSRVHFYKKK